MDKGIYALLAFAAGFVVAQLWKLVAGLIGGEKKKGATDLKTMVGYLTRSGGMPSGHSASMMAVSMYLGCLDGFTSGIFALAMATTLIVAYDAMHVRYAVGEQGKKLNWLLAEENRVAVVEGHIPAQVVVGALLGAVIGLVVFLIFK